MQSQIQLDFFQDPPTDVQILNKELQEAKISWNKLRRRHFASHNELMKMFVELKIEVDSLKKNKP
jgi:hypothetical protein